MAGNVPERGYMLGMP